ncbi:MAG: hypothetical protein HY465_04400 [Deltaproteobacteria bacterium]|nr:hypothetical protein [Deltaproteobacteria bacterium]
MTEPWSKRLSFSCDGAFARYIGTSISPSGIGLGGGCRIGVNDWLEDRYTLGFHFDQTWSDAKLFPSSGVEGGSDALSHKSWQLELGHENINVKHSASGKRLSSLSDGTRRSIGRGSTTSGGTTRDFRGEKRTSPEARASTWDFSTLSIIKQGQWNPYKRLALRAGLAFKLGTHYEHAGSELNQVDIAALLVVDVSLDDAVETNVTAEQALSAPGIVTGAGLKIFGVTQRALTLKTLSQQQEPLNDFFGAGVANDPGRHDLRALQGIQRRLGAAGSKEDQYFFLSSGKGWNLIPAVLQVGGATLAFADGSDAGKTAGVADLVGLGGMATYWAFGIATPTERYPMTDTVKKRKLRHAAYIRYAEPVALFAAGALAGNTAAGRIITAGAAEGAAGVAANPDPLEREITEPTLLSYSPFAPYFGTDGSGSRGVVSATSDFVDSPVYFETRLASHILSVINMGTVATNATQDPQDEDAFGSTGLPTEVDATMGLKKRWSRVRLAAGLDTAVLDGAASAAAVGLSANASFTIARDVPILGDFFIGATAVGHYQLQGNDWNVDIIPSIGGSQ